MEGTIKWRSVNYEVPEYRHDSSNFDLPISPLLRVREFSGFPTDHIVLYKTWNSVGGYGILAACVHIQVQNFMRPELP